MSLEKISFNGKQISVKRAKIIYSLMRLGLYTPRLDNKERISYVEWLEENKHQAEVNLNETGEPFIVPVDERGYLLRGLYRNPMISL